MLGLDFTCKSWTLGAAKSSSRTVKAKCKMIIVPDSMCLQELQMRRHKYQSVDRVIEAGVDVDESPRQTLEAEFR